MIDVFGTLKGLAVTALLLALAQLFTVCNTVYDPDVTVLGLPMPPSLQVNTPITPEAVIEEFPQLFTTVNTGAAGNPKGFAETTLLLELSHPFTVCVTEKFPEFTIRGFPLPPSLQFKVPVTPVAVISAFVQLLTMDNNGGLGIAFMAI
jgi:hypothetical protein